MRSKYITHWQFSQNHLLTTLVAGLLMLQPALVLAADEKDEIWYQIEVIIAQRTDHLPTLESFPFQPPPTSWNRGQTLTPFDPETSDRNLLENVEFVNLPTDQLILKNEGRMLEKNADYKILIHQGWRQIIKGNKTINWVDIRGGYAWAGHQQLEGSLGFSKGRFLHVHSDLHLNQFPSIQSTSSQRAKQNLLSAEHSLMPIVETRYSLIQRRKMRSNELHYLDHPKLVLLVKVIPYTPAEPILEAILEPIPEAALVITVVTDSVAPANEPTLLDLTAPSIVE
jgi:hypothetical protein